LTHRPGKEWFPEKQINTNEDDLNLSELSADSVLTDRTCKNNSFIQKQLKNDCFQIPSRSCSILAMDDGFLVTGPL